MYFLGVLLDDKMWLCLVKNSLINLIDDRDIPYIKTPAKCDRLTNLRPANPKQSLKVSVLLLPPPPLSGQNKSVVGAEEDDKPPSLITHFIIIVVEKKITS